MPRTDDPSADEHRADEHGVEELFRIRYLEMVRLAGLLGADDPEDIAQEAFIRLMRRRLPEPQAALGYLRAIVVNLTRNRHRHLRVVRMRTPAAVAEGSSEQAAILREDHREVIGATGRGLPGVVWAISYPWSAGFPYTKGAHLVFRDASGKQVTVLEPHAPVGPPQTAEPASGGVTLYSYPAGNGEPAGTVQAYLIHGEVGFWSRIWGGAISQRLAAGSPVLGGLALPSGAGGGGGPSPAVALGYAHADVARVVLRADGRQLASAATAAAGWPGSSLRLWHVSVPLTMQQLGTGRPVVTATAYDADGHVVGQVKLGQMY